MHTRTFEPSLLHPQPDVFLPFMVADDGCALNDSNLSSASELIIFERRGQRRALLVQEMAYHHVAQGALGEEPYLVSFCGVCHSGIGLTPIVNEQIYHFQVGGLYNGVVILQDAETGTYWNHLTGQAVYGPLAGTQLDTWNLELSTVAVSLQSEPTLKVLRSHQHPWLRRAMGAGQWLFAQTGYLPKLFTQTMAPEDPRLRRMTMGLGVVVNDAARFYPQQAVRQAITDEFEGRSLQVTPQPKSGVLVAQWEDGTYPLQYFLRWYGFALTFPKCGIYRT